MAYKQLCSVSICLKYATRGAYCKQCATEIMEGRDPKALIRFNAEARRAINRAQQAHAQQMLDDVQDVDFSE